MPSYVEFEPVKGGDLQVGDVVLFATPRDLSLNDGELERITAIEGADPSNGVPYNKLTVETVNSGRVRSKYASSRKLFPVLR